MPPLLLPPSYRHAAPPGLCQPHRLPPAGAVPHAAVLLQRRHPGARSCRQSALPGCLGQGGWGNAGQLCRWPGAAGAAGLATARWPAWLAVLPLPSLVPSCCVPLRRAGCRARPACAWLACCPRCAPHPPPPWPTSASCSTERGRRARVRLALRLAGWRPLTALPPTHNASPPSLLAALLRSTLAQPRHALVPSHLPPSHPHPHPACCSLPPLQASAS